MLVNCRGFGKGKTGPAMVKMRVRCYKEEEEGVVFPMPRTPASDHHPLMPSSSSSSSSSTLLLKKEKMNEGDVFSDPLRSPIMVQDSPLPSFKESISPKPLHQTAYKGTKLDRQAEAAAANWDGYKASILQKFSSTSTITITATLDIITKDSKGKGRSVTATHLTELEESKNEDDEAPRNISQQEYVARLRELNDEIAQAWLNNERVAALKLSIKVVKLLSDTSMPQFYPILFVLVTDVMDTVGNLVWSRIKGKAEMEDDGNLIGFLPENFTADDVREEAKETCSNWFYKIGTIHELLPRIYLEMAIIRCMHFLERDPPVSSFLRLTMMIRGISDPLASGYARLYLARKAQAVVPSETGFLITGLDDFLLLFRRVLVGEFDCRIVQTRLNRRIYVTLVEPIFEWIMQCIFQSASSDEALFLMRTFGEQRNALNESAQGSGPISIVIHYLLKQLPAVVVGTQALELSKIVSSSDDLSMPQYLNYRLLVTRICETSSPRELQVSILNEVWKVVMKYSNLVEYLSVAEAFIEYILQSCSETELTILLRDIARHLKKAIVTEEALAILESVVFKLLIHITDLVQVLALPHFIDILDVFYGDTRLSVYKRIACCVARNNNIISDPVIRHFIFEICKSLYNSLDSMSSEDDRRQISRLIVRFVQLVDFKSDLEQHLSFLVECRGIFTDMDLLLETVVHLSNKLSVITLKMLKGNHSRRSLDFVKACVTFNEITIPSITSSTKRMHLFLETAEVALMNALPVHVDGLIKSSITCFQELENSTDTWSIDLEEPTISFLHKLCSFFIVVPGHPELGPFYLLRGLLNLLNTQQWFSKGHHRVQILCQILCAFNALSQQSLPYHVNNPEVISNDELFYGDPVYHKELTGLINDIVEMITNTSEQILNTKNHVLDVCSKLLSALEMDDERVRDFCTLLLQKAASSLPKDDKYLQATSFLAKSRGIILESRS